MVYEGMCCYNSWYNNGCAVIIHDIRRDVLW